MNVTSFVQAPLPSERFGPKRFEAFRPLAQFALVAAAAVIVGVTLAFVL